MVGLNPNRKLKVLKHLILRVFQHFLILPAAGLEPARYIKNLDFMRVLQMII
ncbi:hypothetical protein AMURIS_04789 [Acetatifactor muris]|uniref:Uncharacterized protein n=1 Tax=Acetatifactor muris TaxID=879566 RepID=A0A2K4ZNN3_9FIRM|nr:hypothetical protein AMURIS_04789 [Acetatifactor muris]